MVFIRSLCIFVVDILTVNSCFIEGIPGDEHKVGINSSSKLDCLKLISFELHQLNYTSLPMNHIV